MKASPAAKKPAHPARRRPRGIAISVELGPGSRLVAATRSRNSASLSQRRRVTPSSCIIAVWAAGPAKDVRPSRRKRPPTSSQRRSPVILGGRLVRMAVSSDGGTACVPSAFGGPALTPVSRDKGRDDESCQRHVLWTCDSAVIRRETLPSSQRRQLPQLRHYEGQGHARSDHQANGGGDEAAGGDQAPGQQGGSTGRR